MSIGENIKKLREERNLTQKQLAEKLNISQAMIAQIERGTKGLSMALGKEIADYFNCSIEELY